MDLIYMNKQKEDVGVLQNYKFDLAYGYDENDFELSTNTNNHKCQAGFIVYIEDTEYGGVIRRIRVKTATDELIYCGDTWHGILEKKVIQPDAGQDYLVMNGEANSCLVSLIVRMGLDGLFKASSESSGVIINNYNMNRYVKGYTGIKKMLASQNAKLKINFQDGFVVLSAEPWVDYSHDDEFDSSQIDFDVDKNYAPVNHVICLGKGDLKEREVIHVYADENGNISTTQTQTGMNEITDTYENANCESSDELKQGGVDMLLESWNSDALQVDLDSAKNYDIGDIVGARENVTGIYVARAIIKKIVTIENDVVTISHKVGE